MIYVPVSVYVFDTAGGGRY